MTFRKATLTILGVHLPTFLLAMIAWGLFDINRLGWCGQDLLSCSQALDVFVHAVGCALVSGGVALLCLFLFREKVVLYRPSSLVILGIVLAGLLVGAYPVTLEVQTAIGTHLFPYVPAIRFGPAGFFLFWGVVSLLVCIAAMQVAMHLKRSNRLD